LWRNVISKTAATVGARPVCLLLREIFEQQWDTGEHPLLRKTLRQGFGKLGKADGIEGAVHRACPFHCGLAYFYGGHLATAY